jgi:hypothetical protein
MADDTDTLELPPPVTGPDPYAVKPYVLQPDAKPAAPYQTAAALGLPGATGGAIGIWPPPGNTPGPMVAPNVQASVRPDGTVAYTPPTPLNQTVAALGVQTPNTNAATLGVKPPVQPASLSSPMITAPADRSDRNEGDDWATARQKIMQPESGGKNLWNYRHDENPGYFTASGLFQIVDSTWREGGQLAGIDVSQWKHAIDAPDDVQDQVAHALYKKYGYAPWTKKEGGPLNPDGTTGGAGGAASGDEYYQRALKLLGGRPYDPSSINPELERIFREREAAEKPIMDANLRRQQRDEAEADEEYSRLKRERDLNDPALRPWTQKPPQPDPIGGLASLGSIFAAFASAFSHTPAIAAMNGMASAIDARNEGNQKQYDEAFQAYKYNAQLALDRNELQQKAYDAAWARVKEDPELGLAQLRSVAQIYGDEQTLLTLESGNLENADKINTGRIEAATKLATELAKVDQFGMFGPSSKDPLYQTYINDIKAGLAAGLDLPAAQLQAQQKYTESKRGSSVAGQRQEQETTIAKQQYTEMYGHEPTDADMKSPEMAQLQQAAHASGSMGGQENVHRMAELIANYQARPPQSRSGVSALIMAEVQRIAPDYNDRLYNAENKALGNFYGGQEGRSVRSINVAIAHLDTLSDLADALKTGDVRTITRLANMVASETGQAAPTNFNLAKQIVGDEINKAIVPGAGGQSERQSLADNLNAANSPEALAGAIKTAQQLLAGQTAGLRQQFVGSTGMQGSVFDGLLMDRTKQVLGTDAADAGKVRPTTPAGGGGGATTGGIPPRPASLGSIPLQWNPTTQQWRDPATRKIYAADGTEMPTQTGAR